LSIIIHIEAWKARNHGRSFKKKRNEGKRHKFASDYNMIADCYALFYTIKAMFFPQRMGNHPVDLYHHLHKVNITYPSTLMPASTEIR
jgi:hypothetical protein